MARSFRSLKEALETGRGSERPFLCPVHADTTPSASVNVDKGVWVCYACGASGKTQDGKHDLSYVPLLKDAPIPVLPKLMLMFTNHYSFSPYWESRYGGEVAEMFATGTDPITGFPTVPIFDYSGSILHGFIKRNDRSNPDYAEAPKYLYPVGLPVSRLLFNHWNVPASPQTLVLVEGASDVMSLYRWPLPPDTAVCAVMGSGLHVRQADLVRRLNPHQVVVALDADEAGVLGAQRSVELLHGVNVRGMTYNWSRVGVNDPGELKESPWSSFQTWARTARPWSPPSSSGSTSSTSRSSAKKRQTPKSDE